MHGYTDSLGSALLFTPSKELGLGGVFLRDGRIEGQGVRPKEIIRGEVTGGKYPGGSIPGEVARGK